MVIWEEPNKFARPAQLELYDHSAVFHGYQEFIVTKDSVRVLSDDLNLQRKQDLLTPHFCPRYLRGRRLLDLGANAGFFCFWALHNGVEKVTALDMDENYLRMVEETQTKMGFGNLEVAKANLLDWNEPFDVVLALALIHWVYSCTALFGSLDSVVRKLAEITKYMLIVEWIDPEDPAIESFHHIDRNKEFVREPYTLEAFQTALKHYFERVEYIGDVSPTRKLYVAFRSKHEIDLSTPLPLIMGKESLIYSRCLTKNGEVEYWSCVYDGGDVIYKQTTLDLAEREAHLISQLRSDYFPRVLDSRREGYYSVVVLEKIHGLTLEKAKTHINGSRARFGAFAQHCLNLLSKLKKKRIMHRDIRPENIIIRDGKPVLIDFGWAISNTESYFTPEGLSDSARPGDGSLCDVYSMGKILEEVNQGRYGPFDAVIELMTEDEGSLRLTNLATLKTLFAFAGACTAEEWGAKI